MYIIFFIVSLAASTAGAICGVGGGVFIKPLLDSLGILDVASTNFLSSFTVLSMAVYSVSSTCVKKDLGINMHISLFLAFGAVLGGIAGDFLFQRVWNSALDKNTVGVIQAICLIALTAGTLIYIANMEKIKTRQIENKIVICLLGLTMGVMSSFLGIGGGPINLVVLYYFFSMDTKIAAVNSLLVIMLSQAANLISTLVTKTAPSISGWLVALMIVGGIAGGIIGRKTCGKITSQAVKKLFVGLLVIIIATNIYNMIRFSL